MSAAKRVLVNGLTLILPSEPAAELAPIAIPSELTIKMPPARSVTKRPTPVFDISYDSVPEKMRRENRWLAFEVIYNDEKKKFDKKPVNSEGKPTNDPTKAESFGTMLAFVEKHEGFVLGYYIEAPYIGIDADNCRDPHTGIIAENIMEVIRAYNSYAEVSPSGTGVRIIIAGKKPGDSCRRGSVEIYSHKRAVTITGLRIDGAPTVVNEADVSNLYNRMLAGEFLSEDQRVRFVAKDKSSSGGRIENDGSGYITTGLEVLMSGHVQSLKSFEMADGFGTSIFYDSPSEAVQGLLARLASKHNCDEEKIRQDFEASNLLDELPHWRGNGKWARLGKDEIRKAVEFIKGRTPAAPAAAKSGTPPLGRAGSYGSLEFKYPAVLGTAFDFVIGPPMGSREGWFPRGDPHLIGGPSASNKSTFMTDLLETQLKGENFLGHETFGLPYLIIMADRGEKAHERTANRMRFEKDTIPIKFLPSVWGDVALRAILDRIEECSPMPAVVFIEGCDMLVENASKMEIVTPFLDGLQQIAKHYHISIIGSVGSPKQRIGEGYSSKRDNIFGTVAWSRKTETVAVLQFVGGDDTDCHRVLAVLLRNGPPEKYKLKMENGRLVVDNLTAESTRSKVRADLAWFRLQNDWFTVEDARAALNISQAQAYRIVENAYTKRILKTKQKAVGGAREYRWNDGAKNPENQSEPEVSPTDSRPEDKD